MLMPYRENNRALTLPRQHTRYTCGIACLRGIEKLLGYTENAYSEQSLAMELNTCSKTGTCHEMLLSWAQENLAVKDYGENTYKGGLAIANIKNKDSGIGHYVILLSREKNHVKYYCPLLGDVIYTSIEDMNWENTAGTIKNWSINFETVRDYMNTSIEAQKRVFLITDPEDMTDISPKATNTTSLLYQEYAKHLGEAASWHTKDNVFVKGDKLYLSGVPVREDDIVWVRLDPVNTVSYYEMLRLLCHVKHGHFINPPEAILKFHDKLTTNRFIDEPYCAASSLENIERAYKHLSTSGYDSFIIKVPSRCGGQGVHMAATLEDLLAYGKELLPDSGYVVVQGFVETGHEQVDTRVLITTDKVLGCVDRVAPEDSFICNLSAGGTARESGPLSDAQKAIVKDIQQFMAEENIYIAALDFLGNFLIETNVSCPAAAGYLNKLNGVNVQQELVKETLQLYHQKEIELAQAI